MRTPARGVSGFVEANGISIHYLQYGAGEPSLLILPGITSPAITWEFVAERLAGAARVIALDLRGRGESEAPREGYTLPDYAADVAGVIDGLRLIRPIILGHSLGARIAAAFGALHRDLAGPMIIADPPLTGPGRPAYPTSRASFEQQLHEAYAGTTADEVRRHYPRWQESELRLRAQWLASCEKHAVMETYDLFEREDFFGYWSKLSAPLLFIYGEQSPVVSAEGAAEVSESNPVAEMVEVADAGHMIPWENLDDFVEVCLAFISRAAAV